MAERWAWGRCPIGERNQRLPARYTSSVTEGTKLKRTHNLGLMLLAVWLILTGLLPFLRISIPNHSELMALLAVIAGVLILMGR